MSKRLVVAAFVAVLLHGSVLCAQEQSGDSHDMSQMNMPAADLSNTKTPELHELFGMGTDGSAHAMHSMQSHHMETGPHMKMSTLRDPKPGDEDRAQQVVEAARKVAEKYEDYRVALADGYKIFLPNLPQKQYHFTNYWYGFEAGQRFNPEHPTSLLYEKQGNDYKLIGVMYTALKKATEDELDRRIPLSIAQWHAHINMCIPPAEKKKEMWGPNPRFGLAGTIATKEECQSAGGKFVPQIFGWMVHVYPFEQKAEDVWSVQRQTAAHAD